MKPVILRPGVGDNCPTATLYYGQDTRETLRTLPEASVYTVCTSPPYWGLRDYGSKDKQIGLEPTPDEFVAALVEVFREVKRVLRPDGTLWLNLGDSYWSDTLARKAPVESMWGNRPASDLRGGRSAIPTHNKRGGIGQRPAGVKPKDLVGIPWRVALALQADGWYLRQDIIWSKPNPMPEAVRDRCTKSHEYIFLFAHPDSEGKYHYDGNAMKERAVTPADNRSGTEPLVRNRRSVWNVNVAPYAGAHFATWPPELVRPMVLAGCPVGGTVLDPFSGSGTTGMVALQEGRHYIGIDLNEDYLPLAMNRVQELPAPAEDDAEEGGGDAFDLFSDG